MSEQIFTIPLKALLTYSDNCRAALRTTLEQHAELFDRQIEPPVISMRSIRHMVSHMAGAEERWIERRLRGRELTDYETRAPESIQAVFEDWEEIRRNTCSLLEALNPDGFRRVYRLTLRGDLDIELSVGQVLFQILNHETHHRAQISFALQQFGVDPPDFDFVLLK